MHIFAIIKPKPEHVDDARAAILSLMEKTRAEAGCRRFDLYQSPDGLTLYLDEIWSGQEAFDAHHAADYTKAVFESYQHWLAEPATLHDIRSVDCAAA